MPDGAGPAAPVRGPVAPAVRTPAPVVPRPAAVRGRSRPAPQERLRSLLVWTAVLRVVASTVTWRRGDLFTGSADPVVVLKAALSMSALGAAFVAVHLGGLPRRRLGTGTLWFVVVFLLVSSMGALTDGTLFPSTVVAVRILVVALTAHLLLRAAPLQQVLTATVTWCGVIGLLAALTGLVAGDQGGRLGGGTPPVHPNELALLLGVVVVWVAARVVLQEATWAAGLTALVFLPLIWLTGSRTGLLMVVLAVLVMGLLVRRAGVGLVMGGLCALAVVLVVVTATEAVVRFSERDGTGASTLESRFIAWSAARSWAVTGWREVFGGGLSVKLIPVEGQWWNQQLLDSSWVSALVQAGALGLVVAVVWVLWTLRGLLRIPRVERVLPLGLLVYVVGRSVLESGLFDATPMFLVLVTVSAAVEGRSRSSSP